MLQAVARANLGVYLAAGTALAIRCGHRDSADLDFFTQRWSQKLHRTLCKHIERATGFSFRLLDERIKPRLAKVAAYEFSIAKGTFIKVDVIEDFDPLLQPVEPDGITSMDDIYLRKVRAAIGWTHKPSSTGQLAVGGRQDAKDLFDLWYLSTHYAPLHEWFPAHFTRQDYQRLTRWLQAMTGQETTFAL
ncbi:MAG: nucleotidyl transferase AbiEii/AbiGii toxin family protein, partial [Candidatus Omnitrophica bacterium]|nr:nucleotidyl transferase AbiEii/AbiGii toxin family protein [Candidatus Omnitrophota bacterium]